MRTLHLSLALTLPTFTFVSLVGVAVAAAPPVSPTRVLAEAAARVGHTETYLASGTTDSTDVDPSADRSLAPYLYVAGGDPATERLPLRETSAHVDISGVIAHVAVRQVFENGGASPSRPSTCSPRRRAPRSTACA
jgi:hypothetical protein